MALSPVLLLAVAGATPKTAEAQANAFIVWKWKQRWKMLLVLLVFPGMTFFTACGEGGGNAGNSGGGGLGGSGGAGGSGGTKKTAIDPATVLDAAGKAAAMSDEDLNAAIAAADLDAQMALAGPSGLITELGGEATTRSALAGVGTQMKTVVDELVAGTLFGAQARSGTGPVPAVSALSSGGGDLGEAFGAGWLGGSLFNAFFVETVARDYVSGKSGSETSGSPSGDVTATAGLSDTLVTLNATANFTLGDLSAKIQTYSGIPCPDVNGLWTVDSFLDVTGQAGNAYQHARFSFELIAEVDDDAQLTGRNQLKSSTQTGTANTTNGYDTTSGSADVSVTQFADGHFGDGSGSYQGMTDAEAIGWLNMGLMSGLLYRDQLLPSLQKMLDAGRCVNITVMPSAGPMNLARSTTVDLLTKPRAKSGNTSATTGGTVQAMFKVNAGGSIAELGSKVPADATFHYVSPPDYQQTETVTFKARSKRGTGTLDYTLTTSPHAE